MPSTDKQVTNAIRKAKIRQLSKVIRKKYQILKLGRTEEDESLNKMFKPITDPLSKIVAQQQLSQAPLKIEKLEPKTETVDDEDADVCDNNTESSDSYHDLGAEAYDKYIQEYFEKNAKIDLVYGPKYDASASKWMLGDKHIEFKNIRGLGDNVLLKNQPVFLQPGEYIIIENTAVFPATDNLYKLIFYNEPGKNFSNEELAYYKEMLELTNAHRTFDNKLKSAPTVQKYRDIIRPMYVKSTSSRSPVRTRSQQSGGGIYNNKPIEYVYWDNSNELCDRLRLLIASEEAGNHSHTNEIQAILNELKEAHIIC